MTQNRWQERLLVPYHRKMEDTMDRLWLERVYRWIADHLPKWLVYYAGIRLWVYATTGPHADVDAPEITMDTVIRDWANQLRKQNTQ